jgi:PAS domain S-box-containing protein
VPHPSHNDPTATPEGTAAAPRRAAVALLAGSVVMAIGLLAALVFATRPVPLARPDLWMLALAVAAGLITAAAVAIALRRPVGHRSSDVLQHRELDKARRLDSVVRGSAQGFWFIDLNGITTELNPAMEAMLGRARDAVLGRPATDFFTGEDRSRMEAEIAARRNGRGGTYAAVIVRPDGTRLACLNTASPITDAHGQATGSVGIWTDLSARHAAEAALHMYQVVVNSTSDMISVLDEEERYLLVNDAWCASTGIPREQALGPSTMATMTAMRTEGQRQAIREAIDDQRTAVVRAWVQWPGRPAQFLESSYYPFADRCPDQRLVVIATRDLTRQETDRNALATAANVLRSTLDATGDALFAVDAGPGQTHLPVRFANEQLFQLFQLPDALRPTPTLQQLIDHIDPWIVDADAEQLRVEAIIDGRGPPQHQLRLRDGRVLLRRYASVPLGEQRLRVWSMRDITTEVQVLERREADAAELRTLLDQYPGYIAVADGNNRYLYVNERLGQRFGRPVSDIVGRHIAEVVAPDRAARIAEALDRTRQQGRTVVDSHYPAAGELPPLQLEVTHLAGPRHTDGQQRVYTFGIDVTETRRAEEVLTRALADAERANLAKSQFLSRMSHELRTPLNAVLGFGQLLKKKRLDADAMRHVGRILSGGQHLLSLIEDLLDLSRVEAGELKIDRQAVPVATVLDDVMGLMLPLALKQGIHMQRTGDAADMGGVWADGLRLRQVLLNLVSNAIKYNRPGGQVELACSNEGDTLEFRVTDSGPGLTPDEQTRLFKPFERLAADQAGIDGTGIGLSLSRNLVEAMQGSIGLRSAPGQGSTFWVRLPVAALPTPRQPEPMRHNAPITGGLPRALYIEDNPVNQALLEAMLQDAVALSVEADPVIGLQRARDTCPDLILLDIQLPGMDGYEVLRRLRDDPLTRDIPVVAVSANAMPSDLQAGHSAGFDSYLPKPVDMDTLLAIVERLLSDAARGQVKAMGRRSPSEG